MQLLQDLWNGILDLTKLLVIPDWGSVIALLPVVTGVLVGLYLIRLVFNYRQLGPRRRRPGRIKPVTPAGIHMPGPTLAPIFAAVGTFLFFAGLVFSGPLLVAGLVVLVLSLLYWGREGLVDYDHIAGEHPQLPAVVHPGPPPGVHMPGPSFRPFLAALGVAIVFAGLVFGGWILAVGVLFSIVALLGWLNDARKEYRQVVKADTTGHLDNEPAPGWPRNLLAIFTVLFVAAIALTAGWFPQRQATAGTGPGSSAAPSGGPSGPALTASNLKFNTASLSTAAGKPFSIHLDNQDNGIPHDVDILDSSGKKLVDNKDFPGPAARDYAIPALPAGSYKFECSVHPQSMNGTLTVGS